MQHVVLLPGRHQTGTYKGRIADDEVEPQTLPPCGAGTGLLVRGYQIDILEFQGLVDCVVVGLHDEIGVPGMYGGCVVGQFHGIPVHAQGIALTDIGITAERQEVDVVVDNALVAEGGWCYALALSAQLAYKRPYDR